MRISYRQGLLSTQANFLQQGQNNFIDLVVGPVPTLATIANRSVNYIIGEYSIVRNAWGPFTGNTTQYLYWEINQVNGSITRGSTPYQVVIAATHPLSPAIGQMWWDTANNTMNVWDGTRWTMVLRVFAGTLQNGSIIVQAPFASQVGLNNPNSTGGFVLTDGYGSIFRDNNGNLLTTDSPVVSNSTGSLVKLENAQVTVQALENLPAFSLVYLLNGQAALASSVPPYDTAKAPIGMVTQAVAQNGTVDIITRGRIVVNQQWSWDPSIWGTIVYCDGTGQVTTDKPSVLKYVNVGTIVGAQSILLGFDWETDVAVIGESVGVQYVSSTAPITVTGFPNTPIVSITKSSPVSDGYLAALDFLRIPTLEGQVSLLNSEIITKVNKSGDTMTGNLTVPSLNLNSVLLLNSTGSITAGGTVGTSGQVLTSFGVNSVAWTTLPPASITTAAPNGQIIYGDSTGTTTTSTASFIYDQNTDTLGVTNITGLSTDPYGSFDLNISGGFNNSGPSGNINFNAGYDSYQNPLNRLTITTQGDWWIQGDSGNAGQVITSQGIGNTPHWASLPGLTFSQVVTALGYVPVNKAGDTMTGQLTANGLSTGSKLTLQADGSILANSSEGTAGQVLTSTGNGTSVHWTTLPVPNIAIQSEQVVFGNQAGTGITSDPNFIYSVSGQYLYAPTVAAGILVSMNSDDSVTDTTGSVGTPGQFLMSQGPVPVTEYGPQQQAGVIWTTLPDPTVAMPDQQVVFGNGTGITSSSAFTYNVSSDTLAVSNVTGLAASEYGNFDLTLSGGFNNVGQSGNGNVNIVAGYDSYGNPYTRMTITAAGELELAGDPGDTGTLMMSGGVGNQPTWQDPIIAPAPMNQMEPPVLAFDFGSSAHHNAHLRLGVGNPPVTVTVRADSFWPGTDQYWMNDYNPANPGPMPIGGFALVTQASQGVITFVPDVGVTINTPSSLITAGEYTKVTLIKVGPNQWDIEGHLG
jgi:hypothetical protein